MSICLSQLSVFIKVSRTMACGHTITAGYIEYCLITQHHKGSQAIGDCQSVGYQLVAVHSQDKHDQIVTLWSRSVTMSPFTFILYNATLVTVH